MSVLTAGKLRRRIFPINPDDPERIFIVPAPEPSTINGASIDLMLGNYFIVSKTAHFSRLDALDEDEDAERNVASYQEMVYVPFDKSLIMPSLF